MKKKLALMTTGGDAPGMNAAIRAVVRCAVQNDFEVFAVPTGYKGLVEDLFIPYDSKSVGNILNRGGTILQSIRFPEFKEPHNQEVAIANLKKHKINSVVVIGGNGSLQGAHELTNHGFEVGFIPASIDNDVYGTDQTIGFDSAINTAMEAIDKIRDTATSHERLFIVEVMGRNNGFIAIEVAIVSGAEAVLIPERKTDMQAVVDKLNNGIKRGKKSSIIITAEGAIKAEVLKAGLELFFSGFKINTSVIGHIQRGGSPTAYSRYLAAAFGFAVIEALAAGKTSVFVGIEHNKIITKELSEMVNKEKKIDPTKLKLLEFLSA